jgi:AcrR family transcriptional regulator
MTRYGYEGASLNRLSDAAGLKRASLYHRFPGGKDEILEAIVGRAGARFEQLLAPAYADGPPRERAELVAANLHEYYQGGSQSCLVIALSLSEGDTRSLGGQCIEAWADALNNIATDSGLDPEAAEIAARDTIAIIEGALVLAAAGGSTDTFERAIKALPDRIVPA